LTQSACEFQRIDDRAGDVLDDANHAARERATKARSVATINTQGGDFVIRPKEEIDG
jgi:hypothetical protein